MHDLFLSYSRRNKRFVDRLAADLRENGIDVWIDTIELEVGDLVHATIEQAIKEARYFCIALSPAALASYYVRQVEFELAFTRLADEGRDSFILPIIIQKLDQPLPLRLASRYYLDFTNRKQYSKNMTSIIKKVSLQDPEYSGRHWYKGLDISLFGEPMGVGEIAQMASNGPAYEMLWEQGVVVQVDVYQNGKKVNHKNFGYDNQGRVVENRMYSPDGKGGWRLADDVWYYTYDTESGRRTKKLMKFPGASSGREVSYDDHGRATEENIVNDGEPDMSYGYARKVFDYSPEGHVIRERLFDYDGNLMKTVERGNSQ